MAHCFVVAHQIAAGAAQLGRLRYVWACLRAGSQGVAALVTIVLVSLALAAVPATPVDRGFLLNDTMALLVFAGVLSGLAAFERVQARIGHAPCALHLSRRGKGGRQR